MGVRANQLERPRTTCEQKREDGIPKYWFLCRDWGIPCKYSCSVSNFALFQFSGSNWHFHYLHSVCNNRWAITYFCAYSKNTYHFHDISDCDGCDCQAEFCFKKLIEVLAKGLKWGNVVDFGPVVDEWNGMEEKAMEKLGTLLKPHMIRIHCPHHCCG